MESVISDLHKRRLNTSVQRCASSATPKMPRVPKEWCCPVSGRLAPAYAHFERVDSIVPPYGPSRWAFPFSEYASATRCSLVSQKRVQANGALASLKAQLRDCTV